MEAPTIKVLVIEDNPAHAAMIQEMLAESRKPAFTVQHVRYLAEGLEQLSGSAFDVILIDLGLPDSQGLETALAVRKQATLTPIVVMTALDDEDAALKALQLDIQDYLIKGEITGNLLKRSIRYAMQRKQDTEALRQSEQRFASFMLNLPAAAWMKDRHGRYVYANAQMERVFSLPFSKFSGKTDGEFLPPETAGSLRENDERVLAEGESLQTIEVLRQADGIEHHSVVGKFPIPGPDGQVAYVAGVALDTTEQVKAVEALQKSERKFAKIFHAAPALVGISTPEEGRFIDVNDATIQLLGYRREEMIGRTALELNIWEDLSDRARVLQALEEKGSAKNIEVRLRGKNGQILVGLFSAEYVDLDGDRYLLSLVRDITERKRAEETLRKSEQKFAKVFNSVPALVSISTLKEGGFVEVNETMLKMLGYRREEMIGRTAMELGIWNDLADRARIQQALEEKGSAKNFEVRFRGKKGQSFVGLFSAEYVDFGNDRYMLSLVKDITLTKQAQQEVELLNTQLGARAAELEEANRQLEAFNYAVAHDLRKPLSTINGYCQIIREACGERLDAECRNYLQEAYDGTWRMSRLIDALLRFSQASRIEPRREQVDFSSMARAVAVDLQHAEPARRVDFRIAEGISVIGDTDLLRVVLANLIGNAWKYTAKLEEAVIEFGVTRAREEKACFVRDNGPGFAMADAEKLFIPFQRVAGKEFAGHGIGLATVERIIRRHGGRIWAAGEPGKGATFYFTLPNMDKIPH
ncbi:PAS domain S-box protein [Geobacter sp. SVR]|uniref:PAS domain S-box protein n=1 Tax=Geobacter sp. SVR TaxID=2495594 RepID=UPI00143F0181|nr:PAS domain S-box protein [Geobacter sp. SVR]BCS52244.1 hypothetical protein GSVR_05520 [Geobacter sp. SVR]GCF85095.1 hypothetical protein GSbR_16950 [Geobacter sp. SVR]